MPDFTRKFSIPHWDNYSDDDIFYRLFKNSAKEYKDEIRDIFFGGEFHYEYKGEQKKYGDVMGVSPSPIQLDNLFKIQDEFGTEISLTLNTLDMGKELASDANVINQMLEFIRGYYERGLRVCTISSTHLMRTGALQEAFPDMNWKNTVNHLVKSTQEVYDYAALGYTTILLDRSLNRDIDLLKEIRQETKKLKIETSLLASESCMPSCPFKQEHDLWQAPLQQSESNYWQTFPTTCVRWRTPYTEQLPRLGINISMATKEIVDEFSENVDVFKFSGRLGQSQGIDPDGRMCWSGIEKGNRKIDLESGKLLDAFEYANSFQEIYEKSLSPYLVDRWAPQGWTNLTQTQQHSAEDISSIWNTKKGRGLSKVLSKCKNRCWDCHACENVFNVEEFNSVLSL
jgi:hypothetical protein